LQQLAGMGAEGWAIAIARQEVLDILEGSNTCSAWYASAQPQPARKFASLFFRVDYDGALFAISRYDAVIGSSFLEPYVARAQESVGAGSTITLNAHGAFFVSRAPIQPTSQLGAIPLGGRLLLRVSTFAGGSLRAQVTTLLHEYAHIVGLLPVDAGEAGSPQLSTLNTEVVLDRCRKQVQASPGHSIILDSSFAALERQTRIH
jgi:hypothetical protein